MKFEGFICPLCNNKLKFTGSSLTCSKNHSFDLAKEGYTYLLPVQKKHTHDPGDSREMVASRARFLEDGNYKIFADALADICVDIYKKQGKLLHILDMGCGEGYYNRVLAERLSKEGIPFELLGIDIAKPAVKRAAKLAPMGCSYAVASCFTCPVKEKWADIIINVFAPFANDEILRILKKGGHLIYAVPGAKHLFGLKKVLYDEPYENKVQDISYPGLKNGEIREVTGFIHVEGERVQDLFCMTPYYWKTPKEGSEKLALLNELDTPIQFRFLTFTKK